MSDLVTIYAPSGRRMRVTHRLYDRVYAPSGWRTSKPKKASGSAPADPTQQGAEPESKE